MKTCKCCGKTDVHVRLVSLGYGGLMRMECPTCCPTERKLNANALWMCQRCGQLRKDVRTVGERLGACPDPWFAHACKACCPNEQVLRDMEDPTSMPADILEAQHARARKDYLAWQNRPRTIEERVAELEAKVVELEESTLPALVTEAAEGIECEGHTSDPIDIDEEDFKELERKVKNMERSWNAKLKRLSVKLEPKKNKAGKK